LLDEALVAVGESGPTGWSMRELARRLGVSHAASARHFRDRRALMTALATEGYGAFGDALEEGWSRRGLLSDVGKAYVRFATTQVARFEVVCRPELYDADDPDLAHQRERVFAVLYRAVATMGVDDPVEAGIAAWASVHGLATLALQGMLPAELGGPVEAFQKTSRYLFQPPP
jgi:AcrR family transcriptional regulator